VIQGSVFAWFTETLVSVGLNRVNQLNQPFHKNRRKTVSRTAGSARQKKISPSELGENCWFTRFAWFEPEKTRVSLILGRRAPLVCLV
jgi:hypothetical protein